MGIERVVGIDIGSLVDYTAVCVLEIGRDRGQVIQYMNCIYLDRLQIGQSYLSQIDEIAVILRKIPGASVALDFTGIGNPVSQLWGACGMKIDTKISIHGGDKKSYENGITYIPKRDIIGGITVGLQSGKLKFAAGLPLIKEIVNELISYEVKINPSTGHDSYNARSGQHDDMILALGCAVAQAHNNTPRQYTILAGCRS